MRLDIPHIEHPELIHPILIGGLQLLPHFRNSRHREPLACPWRTIIAHMIIHAVATFMLLLTQVRKASYMTEIIIAKHHDYIIRYLQALVIVIKHLAIESPHLRSLRSRFTGSLGYHLALSSDNFLHLSEVSLPATRISHRTVFVSTHTNRYEILIVLGFLYSFREETGDSLPVGLPVPVGIAIVFLMSDPFLLRTHHRFVMRSTHNDAIFICQTRIFGVILIEAVALIHSILIFQNRNQRLILLEGAPHGRPETVGLETQQEFEDMRIHLAVHTPKLIPSPGSHAGELIVDKDTTIFYLRLPRLHVALLHKHLLMLSHRHISPPIPWRNAHLSGEFIDAIDGASHIRTGNHQSLIHSLHRMFQGLDHVALPFSLQGFFIEQAPFSQSGNHISLTIRTDNDGITHRPFAVAADSRRFARYLVDIRAQIFCSPLHALRLSSIKINLRSNPGRNHRKSPLNLLKSNKGLMDRNKSIIGSLYGCQ